MANIARCWLCNGTDQVRAIKLSPKVEEKARSARHRGEEWVPSGICAKCCALPVDERRALVTMGFRNSLIEMLAATIRLPRSLVSHYVAKHCPGDVKEMGEYLQHPQQWLRKKGGVMSAEELLYSLELRGFTVTLDPSGGIAITPATKVTDDDLVSLRLGAHALARLLRQRQASSPTQ